MESEKEEDDWMFRTFDKKHKAAATKQAPPPAKPQGNLDPFADDDDAAEEKPSIEEALNDFGAEKR